MFGFKYKRERKFYRQLVIVIFLVGTRNRDGRNRFFFFNFDVPLRSSNAPPYVHSSRILESNLNPFGLKTPCTFRIYMHVCVCVCARQMSATKADERGGGGSSRSAPFPPIINRRLVWNRRSTAYFSTPFPGPTGADRGRDRPTDRPAGVTLALGWACRARSGR